MPRRAVQSVAPDSYSAACHCGALRVEFTRRPRGIVECNCSICHRFGARWSYTNLAAVRIIGRASDRRAYRWGSKGIDFMHCRHCGCVVYYRRRRAESGGRVRIGINTRMLPPTDLMGIRVRRLDGAGSWRFLD